MKDIELVFDERVERIDTLFTSYSTLYEIYITMMKTAQVNKNSRLAFENAKSSIDRKQQQISKQL